MPQAKPSTFAIFLIDGVRYIGYVESGVDEKRASAQVSEPDVEWSHVDENGHFHAFDIHTNELPTLNARRVEVSCDGGCGDTECDGYKTTQYSCHICGEQVEPNWITATRTVTVTEEHWWEATVRGPVMMPGGKVSVRIQTEGRPEAFGIAYVTGADVNFSDATAELELTGVGRLGFRPLPESAAVGSLAAPQSAAYVPQTGDWAIWLGQHELYRRDGE